MGSTDKNLEADIHLPPEVPNIIEEFQQKHSYGFLQDLFNVRTQEPNFTVIAGRGRNGTMLQYTGQQITGFDCFSGSLALYNAFNKLDLGPKISVGIVRTFNAAFSQHFAVALTDNSQPNSHTIIDITPFNKTVRQHNGSVDLVDINDVLANYSPNLFTLDGLALFSDGEVTVNLVIDNNHNIAFNAMTFKRSRQSPGEMTLKTSINLKRKAENTYVWGNDIDHSEYTLVIGVDGKSYPDYSQPSQDHSRTKRVAYKAENAFALATDGQDLQMTLKSFAQKIRMMSSEA